MDKKSIERETQHDLMNVESFSQLPFIRPPPTIKEKGIRLFGIEFGATAEDNNEDSESPETTNTTNNSNNINNTFEVENNNKDDNNNENNRRFECHYCCRNFPTSQALGGHQNAHKRERQHAKRQHLQSTMVHATTFSDPHLYHHHQQQQHQHQQHPLYRFTASSPSSLSSSPSYPTWNTNSSNSPGARFYNHHPTSSYSHHHQQPINGSPLAFWRIPNSAVQSNPSFNHERPLPMLASDERVNLSHSGHGVSSSSSASRNRYVYDSKRSDHVSLDLHL